MDHTTRPASSSTASTGMVDVLVPVAVNQTYSYRVPRGMELKAGDLVGVPLGPREVLAVVWAENANPDPRLHNRLKDVGEKLDLTWRRGENPAPEGARMGVPRVGEPPRRLTPARRRVIEVLSDRLLHAKSEA